MAIGIQYCGTVAPASLTGATRVGAAPQAGLSRGQPRPSVITRVVLPSHITPQSEKTPLSARPGGL